MGDYHRSAWPDGLETGSEGLARRIDALNDEMAHADSSGCHADHHAAVTELRARYPTAPLVSFSHFVPRVELSPEKRYACARCLCTRCARDDPRGVLAIICAVCARYLFFPVLSKAIGSDFLRRRIERLKPVHNRA